MANAADYFSDEQQLLLKNAIARAEKHTSGEIRIFIDSDSRVLIEHCIELSKFIESQLDRDVEDFELNVSSSGLDQPYRLSRQYIKNIGREVSVLQKDNTKINKRFNQRRV